MGSIKLGLLDWYDPVFSDSCSWLLPPPYDTFNEVAEIIDERIRRSSYLKAIIRRNKKRQKRGG